jgi:hypothetical protein
MYLFRRKKSLGFFPWLLAVAVLLRSFIAPGYMLAVSSEEGLGIIFCDGPVSLERGHDDHAVNHHGDEDATQDEVHISPICSQWTTSSLLVFTAIFEPGLFDAIRAEINTLYNTPHYQQYSCNNCVIRGPPSFV